MMRETEQQQHNIVIGRSQACKHCGEPIRILYLVARDRYWLVDDFDPDSDDPMVTHECEGDFR